jgi:hypothetical protein
VGTLIRQPTAWLPIAISLTAFAMVVGYALAFGVNASRGGTPEDEGAPARIFQLLMAAQAVLVVAFASRWLPRAPRPAARIIVAQLLGAAVPIASILYLESSIR